MEVTTPVNRWVRCLRAAKVAIRREWRREWDTGGVFLTPYFKPTKNLPVQKVACREGASGSGGGGHAFIDTGACRLLWN
jgi:hypothetical protein